VAPADRRVDLTAPTFSDPMAVTNPLHPGARTDQVIYGGQVDGGTFRTEFTRLPEPKRITWAGRTFDAVTMQYLAFQDGRVAEVALDWFAQADDGAVWYIGEDVFNYEEGVVADTEGTWVAGPRTPAAMIMPARPRTGDVYRPENAPGVVFEEVLVRATDRTVPGPSGPVSGAAAVRERSADGVRDALLRVAQDELTCGSRTATSRRSTEPAPACGPDRPGWTPRPATPRACSATSPRSSGPGSGSGPASRARTGSRRSPGASAPRPRATTCRAPRADRPRWPPPWLPCRQAGSQVRDVANLASASGTGSTPIPGASGTGSVPPSSTNSGVTSSA
jgi:hypothetical protein